MPVIYLLLSIFIVHPTWADDQNSNIHLQTTAVSQQHGEFLSPYSGQNSLTSNYDNQSSLTLTIYSGVRLWHQAEVYINPEFAGGSGFDGTRGLAGFSNGEIYRVDDPSPKWNLARLFVKQTFNLGGETEQFKDDKNQLADRVDINRVTLVVGKFALDDFLDSNLYSHDPRTQFLNWALMDYGAWDYAADTKGYSWGLYLEWNQPRWTLRFASVLVGARANQMEMDKNFVTSRGDNLEVEYRYSTSEHPGVARLLVYENHANMGSYRNTINTPAYAMDITQSRSSSVKYGLGLNVEQSLRAELGAFLRASWNDGHTETWAFTEIDQSLSVGLNLKATAWHRADDNIGVALILNGLSQDHRDYLAGGGYGVIIGDGKLNYAPEEIGEFYYLYKLMKGLDLTGDYQFVKNPAYNSDRGPVSILSMRLHYEI